MQTSNSSTLKAIAIFDIDGVIRDVGQSYRRALADTVEQFTQGAYRPTQADIDQLKGEGIWNNDWEGSQEMVYRYFEAQGTPRDRLSLDFEEIVAFFQSRYRGTDPVNWNGYITTEPILVNPAYLESLTQAGIGWGFFSGATRGSAEYILTRRLGLQNPILIAMEDAPGKPDPTGLFATLNQISSDPSIPVLYLGDTVADMYTIDKAKLQYPSRQWIGVGILPPHVHTPEERRQAYTQTLKEAGATVVYSNIEELTPAEISQLIEVR
ncbi:MAG: TIGR01548 family HAD-type hydrolase [Desertifilum sp.]|nr:TIGR01548 family HAD-type hydrolase [Desertifilum sp.]